VRVVGGRLALTIGAATGAGPAHGLAATVSGAVSVKGVTLEGLDATLTDRTPHTPLDPTKLSDGRLAVAKGKATIPRALIEKAIAEKLAPKAPKGATVAYEPGGLAVTAAWHGIPISGHVRLSAAGADGIGLTAEAVKVGPVPVPNWLALRLASWLGEMPTKGDRVMLDLGKLLGAELGPVTSLKLSETGVSVALGGAQP
jgi:hypothetical protein